MAKKRNEKESPFVPVEEQPYQVPGNWCWVRLKSINHYSGGSVNPIATPDDTFELYSVPSSASGFPEIVTGAEIGSSKQTVMEGDVLLCKINPRINRVWLVSNYTENMLLASSEWIVVRNEELDSRYLMYCFRTQFFREYMLSNVSGVGGSLMRAQPKFVKEYPVPIAPLAEQQRIVDRIEGLLARLDEAKDKAQEALESFELRKSAILNKAFDGSLTSEWRQMHPGVSAEPYLQKLKEMGNGISRQEFDFWNNDELPDTWCESKIGKLLYFAGRIGWKGLKAEEYTEEGPLFLSVYNLNDGDEVTFHHVYHITKERYEESPEIMVQVGDVLLTKDGAGIGKLGYVSNLPQEATINSSLLLIRPGEAALSKYVYYLLLSPKLQDIVKERITGSATPHLFQRDIKEFVIPVPPIEEQTEIVRILDHFFDKENQAKEKVETTLETIETMRKAILAKAFRGELGTNNPEDESAEELLKRTLS